MASVSESQVVDNTLVSFIRVYRGVKIIEAYYRNVMLLQQFLPFIRQISVKQAPRF